MKTGTQGQEDVLAELKWEPSVNAAEIGVEVKGRVVTLTGHVGSFAEKWDAERAAQRVAGVKALAVEIDVVLPGASRRNDADIARAAENALKWMTYSPKDSVKVMVEGGCITLSGEVDWEYQLQTAAMQVIHLMGVTGVSDQISLRPQVFFNAVNADIEASRKRRTYADAQLISVELNGADVTLSRTVHNRSERELARHSSRSTPSARHAVHNINVAH